MDTLSQFRSIEELVKMLGREKVLLREMFERRKSMAFRASLALEIVEYKRERVRFLIDHGVIHANGDFLELEDVYVKFFEEVLDMNEEISVASVKEYIDSLKENINYWLEETNEQRRLVYMGNVRKILRRIGLRTFSMFSRPATRFGWNSALTTAYASRSTCYAATRSCTAS